MLLHKKGKEIGLLLVALIFTGCAPNAPRHFRDPESIRKYVSEGGDPSARFEIYRGNPKSETTLLHWAVRESDAELAKFLITNGANPNAQDYDGQTPLMVFFTALHEEERDKRIFDLLFVGTNLDIADSSGEKVSDKASRFGTKEWIALLSAHTKN
jgi:ankyrin repeat protein